MEKPSNILLTKLCRKEKIRIYKYVLLDRLRAVPSESVERAN